MQSQGFNSYDLKTKLAHRDKMTDVFNQMDEKNLRPKRFNLNNLPAPFSPSVPQLLARDRCVTAHDP
jgi:hypothetical protein